MLLQLIRSSLSSLNSGSSANQVFVNEIHIWPFSLQQFDGYHCLNLLFLLNVWVSHHLLLVQLSPYDYNLFQRRQCKHRIWSLLVPNTSQISLICCNPQGLQNLEFWIDTMRASFKILTRKKKDPFTVKFPKLDF